MKRIVTIALLWTVGLTSLGMGAHLTLYTARVPDQFDVISTTTVTLANQRVTSTPVNFSYLGYLSSIKSVAVNLSTRSTNYTLLFTHDRGNLTVESTGVPDPTNLSITIHGYDYFPRGSQANASVHMVIQNRDPGHPWFNLTITRISGRNRAALVPQLLHLLPAFYVFGASFLLAGTFQLRAYRRRHRQCAAQARPRPGLFSPDPQGRNLLLVGAASLWLVLASTYLALLAPGRLDFFQFLFPAGVALVVIAGADFLKKNIFHRVALSMLVFLALTGALYFLQPYSTEFSRYVFLVDFARVALDLLFYRMLVLFPAFTIAAFVVFSKTYYALWRQWKLRRTKRYQVQKYQARLRALLDEGVETGVGLETPVALPGKKAKSRAVARARDYAADLGRDPRGQDLPPRWKANSFIQYLQQLEFTFSHGTLYVANPRVGRFFLLLTEGPLGFDLVEKPLWVPLFCEPQVCPLVERRDFAIPFNACLVTRLPGYQTATKFSTREIEILTIALFLREGDLGEILQKITEGTIAVRHPGVCLKCHKTRFIREQGVTEVDPRPDMETFMKSD